MWGKSYGSKLVHTKWLGSHKKRDNHKVGFTNSSPSPRNIAQWGEVFGERRCISVHCTSCMQKKFRWDPTQCLPLCCQCEIDFSQVSRGNQKLQVSLQRGLAQGMWLQQAMPHTLSRDALIRS